MKSDRPAPLLREPNLPTHALPRAAASSDTPPPTAANDTLPARIGARYHVVEQLGRGGMAVVYRVRDGSSAAELALKQLIIHGDEGRDRETNSLFEREFYTLAQLSHPSVIEVYDYGVAETGPYYTMELLDGGDLGTRAPLEYRAACEVMIEVCSSLSLLHSRRLLHRDISPRNIRCTLSGAAKLIDFGAMVPMGSSGPSVGTPAFIAPEVLHHLSLDARADLFSLGATLYFTLTGRPPLVARAFSELREAWSHEPLPAGQLVAGIPPALDALLFSLLSIDPARRPRSAFEVMQRLAAIAGKSTIESAAISQAYLATPTLVARDSEQQRLRSRIRRALSGRGGAMAIEGPSGLGRSRLLDACVLDGKTLGATVLRVSGRAGTAQPLQTAQALASQLLEATPQLAQHCAQEAGVLELLFVAADGGKHEPGATPRLRPLAELDIQRPALQAALTEWLKRVCREQTLVIAVDDVERIDEPSLALLAGLSHAAVGCKLLIVVAVQTPITAGTLPALDVLRAQCAALTLAPFTRSETDRFFSALFGDVPQVSLVADRIYKLAAGNPRESMALAQHMLDRRLIRYADGQWILPTELTLADFPANAEAALLARVDALPLLGRRLLEAQALSLALQAAWTRADYAELIEAAEHAELDAALDALLQQGMLVSDSRVYTLAHHTLRRCLIAQLSAADLAQRHQALAKLSVRKLGAPGLVTVHHLLQADDMDRALDQLATLLEAIGDRVDFYEHSRMEVKDVAAMMERAYELVSTTGRRPREKYELARHLLSTSVAVDNALYERYAPTLLAQLERDSGLLDYRACPASMPANERLQTAATKAMARFGETPERERVYRLDEAIKFLARFVTVSIVIGVRGRDSQLLASLPGILEPFAGISAVLHALWQNLVSATEMNFLAQPLQARARALEVYESLGKCGSEELRYVETIRYAVSFALGVLEVGLGYPTASTWIERLDKDRMQQVNAMRLRNFQNLYEGNLQEAERYRSLAEVLAVQASSRQMFDSPIIVELSAHWHATDLSGVKRVADRAAQRANQEPRWLGAAHLAQGLYQQLRGDFAAAHEAFERSIALDSPARSDAPPWLDTWRVAAAGKITVLVELGRAAEARAFGEQSLSQATQLGLGPWAHDIVRALALAEAKQGEFAQASQRLDALIAQRAEILPWHLAADYEARACVAIWANDTLAAAHFASLAVRNDRVGRHATLLVRQSRLLDEARTVGMDVAMLPTDFESAVLGDASGPVRRAAQTKVIAALHMPDPALRAQRALELLCQAAHVTSGQLYLVREQTLERCAALDASADPALDAFAAQYWASQLQDELATCITRSSSEAGELSAASWTDASGHAYRLLLLKCMADRALCYVGLVALQLTEGSAWPALYWELATAVSTRLLELGDVQGISPD